MLQGAFMPRFATAMGSVMLVGREFYRFGYHDKDGASSKVIEFGAVPLNAAGFFLIGSLSLLAMKRRTGDFWSRRKFVKYFTHSRVDKHLEEVIRKANIEKRKPPEASLLPMHPKIME